jgi:hypothetical protein
MRRSSAPRRRRSDIRRLRRGSGLLARGSANLPAPGQSGQGTSAWPARTEGDLSRFAVGHAHSDRVTDLSTAPSDSETVLPRREDHLIDLPRCVRPAYGDGRPPDAFSRDHDVAGDSVQACHDECMGADTGPSGALDKRVGAIGKAIAEDYLVTHRAFVSLENLEPKVRRGLRAPTRGTICPSAPRENTLSVTVPTKTSVEASNNSGSAW